MRNEISVDSRGYLLAALVVVGLLSSEHAQAWSDPCRDAAISVSCGNNITGDLDGATVDYGPSDGVYSTCGTARNRWYTLGWVSGGTDVGIFGWEYGLGYTNIGLELYAIPNTASDQCDGAILLASSCAGNYENLFNISFHDVSATVPSVASSYEIIVRVKLVDEEGNTEYDFETSCD